MPQSSDAVLWSCCSAEVCELGVIMQVQFNEVHSGSFAGVIDLKNETRHLEI